jgi:L-asparaginase/Glu-tRNA(Gln) amidotransferase subunit D
MTDSHLSCKGGYEAVLTGEDLVAAVNKGVLVVMNGQINSARDVTKSNTSHLETFRSLEFGQLGLVDEDGVRFYRAPILFLFRTWSVSQSTRPLPHAT